MKLYTPSKEEALVLLNGPAQFLGFSVVEDSLPPAFLLERAVKPQSNYWDMPRLFIDLNSDQIIGSACFKAEPKDGKVEIGYGVSHRRRCQGFASEGVALLVEEAFASGVVDTVLASTTPNNISSKKVLEKLGFRVYGNGVDEDEGRWSYG